MKILELDVLSGVVGHLPGGVFGLKAVENIAVVVDDEDVFYPDVLAVEQRVFDAADDLIDVLVALETVEAESDAGHDGLFLLDDHPGVVLHRAEVEVVLNAEGKSEHKSQQEEEAGPEAFNKSWKSHMEFALAFQ